MLGHYKPHVNGWKSLISDTNFFLAPTGRINPRAELIATVHAWLDSTSEGRIADLACRFPARICWLKNALGIPDSRMPGPPCKKQSDLMQRIAPHEAVLVFPGAAFKGLGAMFGHTLIRFDAKEKRPLISYSVSFSALSEGNNLLSYIWKGLTGGFNGYYSLAPYYQKLHEYRDMEERDVWEYPLVLNPEEVNMMVLHSIELQSIASKYFFLDENCALNLLFIIEAGRPSLKLLEHYWEQSAFWVIPSDTILFLWSEGILKQPVVEVSASRQFDYLTQLYRPLVIEEAKRLADVGNGKFTTGASGLSPEEMELARELAAKIVQYRFSKLQMRQETFRDKYAELIQGNEDRLPKTTPAPTPPQEAHPSGRIETAFGYLNSDPFFELGWRPAYHDWDDSPQGYPDQGTLNFLDIRARYYPNHDDLRLQQLKIIEGSSLSPSNPITEQTAWSFSSGLSQTYLRDYNEHLLFYLDGGAGKSFRVEESGMMYCLIKGSLLFGSGLNKNVDIGPEVEIGLSRSLGQNCQINLAGTTAYYCVSEKGFTGDAKVSLIRFISRKNAVSLNAVFSGVGWNRGLSETLIRWQYYF